MSLGGQQHVPGAAVAAGTHAPCACTACVIGRSPPLGRDVDRPAGVWQGAPVCCRVGGALLSGGGVLAPAACAGGTWRDPSAAPVPVGSSRYPCPATAGGMDAPRRGLVSALSVSATLLLLLTAAPGGCAAATGPRVLTPAAETAGDAGAGAGAAGPPAGDPVVAAKLLSASTLLTSYNLSSFSDAMVLEFRDTYKDLGVSMDDLMDAATAGNLAEYETTINQQRNSTLNMVWAISRYRAIMQSLYTGGRCLDFVRQSHTDDPTACDVIRWRRCCRGTANDADQVLFCAKHENLNVSPAYSVATHPANSFRVRPLPVRAAIRRRMSLAALRRRALRSTDTLLNASTDREQGRREKQLTAAATWPRTVPTTAREDTVVPCFFEDQYKDLEPTSDDAWSAWCKEFLFFGSGCVEYCCTTEMAGSAVCNTDDDPDRCT